MRIGPWCHEHRCSPGDCFVIHYPAATIDFPKPVIAYGVQRLLQGPR